MNLLIDNYDSFTFNLYHRLGELGHDFNVIRNDDCSVAQIQKMGVKHLVLSPGPGTPKTAGVCIDLVRALPDTPVLGICLGMQAIACAYGGQVIRATPMHGKISDVHHQGKGIFAKIPNNPMRVTRYHSLVVDRDGLPDDLQIGANIVDGDIMAIHHATNPHHGLQFHPESIKTPDGYALLQHFMEI
ncbi:MAG: aminodeoxychorismate/anthranilate synthase component II, partial [Pseudomonadota bacterium]